MNDKQNRIVIFHIYRKDGSALFLHPFDEPEILLNLNDDIFIEGKYGKEPRVDSLTLFRNKLYRIIELTVKDWVQEAKFIPRFIVAAGVFLVAYFFTSLVIRDPIPIIDEVVISLISAIVVYFVLSKRDQSSEKASKRRISLRIQIDKIVFTESNFVKKFEEILHYNESVDTEKLVQSMLSYEKSQITKEEAREADALLGYLEKIFSGKIYRKQEKRISKLKALDNKEGGVKHIVNWARSNKVDLSLFASYRNIKTGTPL